MNLSAIEAHAQTGSRTIGPKFSHAVLLLASQVTRWVLRLGFVIAVARALGPKTFGVYALLFSVTEILAVASGSGYADYLTREAARDDRVGWGLASQLTLLRIAVAVPIGLAEVGILHLLGYPRLVLVFSAWIFLTLAPRSMSEAVQGVLRGVGGYAGVLAVELGLGLTLVAGAALLLTQGGGLSLAVGTEIIAALMGMLVGLAFASRLRTEDPVGIKLSRLLKTSAVFNVYALIGNLYDRLDVVLLSKLAGDYATGIYSVAYRALGMSQTVSYGLLYSLLPSLSRGPWGRAERERVERAMDLLLSAAFFLVLATTNFAGPAVRLLLGARYAESAVAVEVLILAVIPRYMNYALNIGLLAIGRERVFLATSSVCLAVNFIGNLVFIPVFSWRAAAALTIVTELVLLAQNVYWIRKAIGVIPWPRGTGRTSLVFSGLLAGELAVGRYVSSLLMGTVCLAFFIAYLHRAGALAEFGEIWRPAPTVSA